MRRIGLWLLALALLAFPVLAQPKSMSTCAAKAIGPDLFQSAEGAATYQPLKPEQRLYYGLAGLGQESPLEVRYFVKDKPYLTEIVDLANSHLPRINDSPKSPLKSKTALDLDSILKEERMVELLTLRPDLVRRLHQLAKTNDTPIKIEVHQDGRVLESLSFQDLTQRSAELAKTPVVSLVVQSSVSGPGAKEGEKKIRSVVGFDYLPDCGDCTSSTPCDTECGYDPGKGGPVTCGEYGVCGSTCACSTVISEYWTGWYFIRSYIANQYACLRSFSSPSGSAYHQLYVEEYRRDRYRRTLVCPSCPSCSNCYYQDQLIGYEILSVGCWFETVSQCSNGATPCCSALCDVGPFTPCNSNC